jgi:Diacylglycerol kinase catalytic domain
LKYLADKCEQYDVEWDISIPKKYSDAAQQARDALARGVDLIVGSSGDGTQHEIANIGPGLKCGWLNTQRRQVRGLKSSREVLQNPHHAFNSQRRL